MGNQTELTDLIRDLSKWVRVACFAPVKQILEQALPDEKSRRVYQMSDGEGTIDSIRKSCKVSPNIVVEIQQKCVALGLMESVQGGRKRRLFNIDDFGLKY